MHFPWSAEATAAALIVPHTASLSDVTLLPRYLQLPLDLLRLAPADSSARAYFASFPLFSSSLPTLFDALYMNNYLLPTQPPLSYPVTPALV